MDNEQIKRPRGRPKGSKNKDTSNMKGRPIGTKNKEKFYREMQQTMTEATVQANELLQKQSYGVAIHSVTNQKTPTKLLEDVIDYSDPNLEKRDKTVALARNLRAKEGVCASAAELLIDLTATNGRFSSDNEELQIMLNKWLEMLNSPPIITGKDERQVIMGSFGLRSIIKKIVDAYLTDGDAIISTFWQNNVKLDINETKAHFLPTSMKVLDSLTVSIDPDLAQLGIERMTLKLSDALKAKILKPETPEDKFLVKSIPKDWISFLKKKEDIVLDPNVTYHLKRNCKDYAAFGESMFIKAFTAIANKRRLQAVDAATIDGLINRFTIFMLGLEDREKNPAYHYPSAARQAALVSILQNPKRANAIVWGGPDLKVQDIGADGKILEFMDRYKQADRDILKALHIPSFLIDGSTDGKTLQEWLLLLSTETGLDLLRMEIQNLFSSIGIKIAVANGITYKTLTFKLDTQILKDPAMLRNMALKVFELGGLSIKTFLESMGYDFNVEKINKEREKESGVADLFLPEHMPGYTGLTPQTHQGQAEIENDGRPDNTPNSVPNEEAASFVSAKTAEDENSVNLYASLYRKQFDKIKDNLDKQRKQKNITLETLSYTLMSGFAVFKSLVDSELKNIFYKYGGRSFRFKEDLDYLLKWNFGYIDNFYKQSQEELAVSYMDDMAYDAYLDKQYNRLFLYAEEGFFKAKFVGELSRARNAGFNYGIWSSTIDDRTCDFCMNNNGHRFSISQLRDIYPAHVKCRCSITYVKG